MAQPAGGYATPYCGSFAQRNTASSTSICAPYSYNGVENRPANHFVPAPQPSQANSLTNVAPSMQANSFFPDAGTGMVFLNDQTEHLQKIANSGPVRCWDHGCDGRQFSSLGNYRRHLKERNQACERFYCPRCARSFSRSTAMKEHFEKTKCKLVYFDSQGFPITVPFLNLPISNAGAPVVQPEMSLSALASPDCALPCSPANWRQSSQTVPLSSQYPQAGTAMQPGNSGSHRQGQSDQCYNQGDFWDSWLNGAVTVPCNMNGSF